MSRYAVAFPGQGTLYKTLLLPYRAQRAKLAHILDPIDEAMGEKFSDKLFDMPLDQWLLDTRNAQPAVVATSLALHTMALRQEPPLYYLGHSLGEYTALAALGIFDAATAVLIARRRAELVTKWIEGKNCGMMALLFRSPIEDTDNFVGEGATDAAMRRARDSGVLAIVNTPHEVVLSGTASELDGFILTLPRGVRKIPLATTIPFHSEHLRGAAAELAEFLAGLSHERQKVPIVLNVTGDVSESAEKSIANTVRANYEMVHWWRSLMRLERTVDDVVNVGPGAVLDGFLRRTKWGGKTSK